MERTTSIVSPPGAGWVDAATLPFTCALEREFEAIRAEADALRDEEYADWPEPAAMQGRWRVFPLFLGYPHPSAERVWRDANPERCPRTLRLLRAIPGVALAAFSRLDPGCHVYAHADFAPRGVVRCHLGLRVPPGCLLRVSGESRSWSEGRLLAFASAAEHEAVNPSATPRVVLLVDYLAEPAARAV